ncbi:Transposase [Parafrankia irregularis]|uniref:Transposase n=2 Tax=Frankiales TaxID=85013 RepID=A0A0S4QXW9_9ACTN|nr:transposase [Frankia sp. R43]CUU59740.1 Transposase [Parafrankia irregularis]
MMLVVSLQPRPWPEVPPLTAQVARAAFPKGNLAMRIRDELGVVYEDGRFTGAFGVRGRPGISPAQLMMATVLQFAENLTDRQAADAVRDRMSWKYALGLDLDDPGFDASVFTEFRTRLVAGDLATHALDALLARLVAQGLLTAGGRARTDSTHVLGAIRQLCRLELAGETVRAALEALASAAPAWLGGVIDDSWQRRYGARVDTWRLPASETKRKALMVEYGRDGYHLLAAVHARDAPVWLRQIPAVDVLRRVWVQQFYRYTTGSGTEVVRRRENTSEGGDGLPPGRDRLISPYDLDTRHSLKRDQSWDGYKVHLTETCTPPDPAPAPDTTGRGDVPNLIIGVLTTPATTPDAAALDDIHTELDRNGLAPDEHLLDSGYPSANQIIHSARAYGIRLVTPILLDHSHQAKARAGYDKASFSFDFDRRRGTCPQGRTSSTWNPSRQRAAEVIVVTWTKATCGPCPAREQCTKGKQRHITLRDRELHEATVTARAAQTTDEWKRRYAARSGIEGTIRQTTHVTGIRTARYRGLSKTSLEHTIAATAINMIRLDAYWTGKPLDRTRTTHLTRLDLTHAA